jgi:hypothetical protein
MVSIDFRQDTVDIRDVIERYEELDETLSMDTLEPLIREKLGLTEYDEYDDIPEEKKQEVLDAIIEEDYQEEQEEFEILGSLLDDLRGYGGDHQWQGNWYPITLIRDEYFEEYAKELARDIGAINDDMQWPYTCIDWTEAAEELQQDYSTVDFGDETYWYR